MSLTHIAVSLDGDEECHDLIRGNGSFSRTMNGIRNLLSQSIIPDILFTPLKINYSSFGKMVEILSPMGIKRIGFNALHPTGRSRNIYKQIMLDHFTEAVAFAGMVEKIKKNNRGIEIKSAPFVYQCYPDMFKVDALPPPSPKKNVLKKCSAAHTSCTVTAGGWILPCSELRDFKGGNVKKRDFTETWIQSERLRAVRDVSNFSSSDIVFCRKCRYNIFCNGGCRADAYAVYNDLLAPDPNCPYWDEAKFPVATAPACRRSNIQVNP